MSILSSLVGLIPGVGPVAKTAIDGLSGVLGGAAKGSQTSQQANDNAKLQKGQLQLSRDKFAVSAPQDRLKAGILASLGKNATPGKVTWGGPGSGLRGEIPTYSGGTSSIYSALKDPSVQGLQQSTLDDELSQQLGQHDSSLGDAGDVGQESTGSKILGAGALGSSILSLLLKNKKPSAVQPISMGGPSDYYSDDNSGMGG